MQALLRTLSLSLLLAALGGCSDEPATSTPATEPAPDKPAETATSTDPVPDKPAETATSDAPEDPVTPPETPSDPPVDRGSAGTDIPPRPSSSNRSPEEVSEIQDQEMQRAEEQVRQWMAGLGVKESNIDPHHLDLTSVKSSITDRALRGLELNVAVESIKLDGTRVTGTGVQMLTQLPNLRVVSLRNCQQLLTGDLLFLVEQTSLEEVDLRGCKNIDPRMFSKLAQRNTTTKFLGP